MNMITSMILLCMSQKTKNYPSKNDRCLSSRKYHHSKTIYLERKEEEEKKNVSDTS